MIEPWCWKTSVCMQGVRGSAAIIRRSEHEQTTHELLANLEHELRISRDSVRLGLAAREHERHLHVSRREPRAGADPLARRPGHGFAGPADYWIDERSHVESTGPATALLSDGRGAGGYRAFSF